MPHHFYTLFQKKIFYYLLLLALVIGDRLLVLQHYNFLYVANDEVTFWQAASDYSKGIFHEPYFYGQNYNFMLEALFAVPLILLDVPHHLALPATTAFMSLFPFFLFSAVLYHRGYFAESLVFLLIPLSLPPEYGMMASMSRGFVSGLFFAGFFIYPLLQPASRPGYLIGAAALALGFVVNANSLVVSLPICLYIWLHNYRSAWYYLITAITVAPILWMEFLAKDFYVRHPQYNIHPMWELTYNFRLALSNFSVLDDFFPFFTPFVWPAGWLVLPLILLAGILLVRTGRIKAWSLVAGVLFIFATLGINKVNDNVPHLLLSSGRMFMGIPLLAGLAFCWIRPLIPLNDAVIRNFVIVLASAVFFLKAGSLKPLVAWHTREMNLVCVAQKKVALLQCECEEFQQTASAQNAGLVVFIPNWTRNHADMEFYNYACPLLVKDFPPTLLSSLERRTWVYEAEKNNRRKNILLIGLEKNQQQVSHLGGHSVLSIFPPVLMVKNNRERLDTVLTRLGYDYQR